MLGLGSNLGDPARSLTDALAKLQTRPQIELVRRSRFRETPPIGGPAGQANYLNAAALVRTSLSPTELLRACQEIENDLGRYREERWGPRTIDIDLLLFDDLVLNEPGLQIPHPRMAWRRFVLEPAAEIAAEMVHPVVRWTVGHLLYHLNSTPWYLAIEGPVRSPERISLIRSPMHFLATGACERLRSRLMANPFDMVVQREFYYRNPSSHKWQIKLEFLQQRVRELDEADPAWASLDRPTISDFWSELWFERSAALAKDWLPAEQYADFLAVWTELRWHIVRPRLIAIVCNSTQVWGTYIPKRGLPPNEQQLTEAAERSMKELEERLSAVGGPILRIASDRQAALVELAAAVEAMR